MYCHNFCASICNPRRPTQTFQRYTQVHGYVMKIRILQQRTSLCLLDKILQVLKLASGNHRSIIQVSNKLSAMHLSGLVMRIICVCMDRKHECLCVYMRVASLYTCVNCTYLIYVSDSQLSALLIKWLLMQIGLHVMFSLPTSIQQ